MRPCIQGQWDGEQYKSIKHCSAQMSISASSYFQSSQKTIRWCNKYIRYYAFVLDRTCH